jgi:diguanylate cyclase (GGDEF)-like protein
VAQRERAVSLKVESAILESISDCFISLDAQFRLIYVNDAACAEFAVDRENVLASELSAALVHFVSAEMVAGLEDARQRASVTAFEAQNRARDRWYEMRCFPKADGLSVYFQNITTRRIADAKIEHLAFHDALTSLPNCVLLRQRLSMALSAAARRNAAGALLFIDLDDFKMLNDTLGHDAGDRYLQEIARRLTACVRREDTVARFGGDEFVVVLESLGDDPRHAGAHAKRIADKIVAALAMPYRTESIEHSGSAGIGIAFFGATPDTVDDVLKRADLAMYRAKASGRNGIAFFDPAMQSLVSARAALLADVRIALARREFTLYYQPQIDRDGGVVGAEALLRWPHSQRGMVSPSEFVPLAEEAGLIGELGRCVLATACEELARWSRSPGLDALTLAVNVSLRQFADPQFVSVVLDALREAHADPRRLKLELTESSAMQNVDDTIAKMGELKRYGIGFSIDDFGTGYSSLSHLKRLPLDQLKIDRSFVSDISSDNADLSIVRTLVALGDSLGLAVIAEGVETGAQRQLLEREGCFFYQGFLYSPALPAAEFSAFALAMPSRAMLEA